MTRRDDLGLSHGATAKVRENAVKQDRVRVTNAIGHHPERPGFLRRTEFIGGTAALARGAAHSRRTAERRCAVLRHKRRGRAPGLGAPLPAGGDREPVFSRSQARGDFAFLRDGSQRARGRARQRTARQRTQDTGAALPLYRDAQPRRAAQTVPFANAAHPAGEAPYHSLIRLPEGGLAPSFIARKQRSRVGLPALRSVGRCLHR